VQNKQHSKTNCQYDNGMGNQLGGDQPLVPNNMLNFGNVQRNNVQYIYNQQQIPQQQYGFNMRQYYSFPQQLSPQNANLNINRGEGFINNGHFMNQMQYNTQMRYQNVIPQQQGGGEEQTNPLGLNTQDVNLLPRTKHVGKEVSCPICLCEV